MPSVALMKKLSALDPALRDALLAVMEEVASQKEPREESIPRAAFDELTNVVRRLSAAQELTAQTLQTLADAQARTEQCLSTLTERVDRLAQAQERTELRLNELAEAQSRTERHLQELAQAQSRTEQRLNELAQAQAQTEQRLTTLTERVDRLAEAQERTEKRLDELASAQIALQETVERLALGLGSVRDQVGGLSRTMAYALENEAYRYLPDFLKERHGIVVLERLVRTEIAGREVNFFGRIRKDGHEGHLVGECVLRLDDRMKLAQIQVTIDAVEETLGGPVIPVIVTHFAKKDVLEKARQRGILVVQSFEW
ncbi:hypothetical protein [Desulfosoma sp.]